MNVVALIVVAFIARLNVAVGLTLSATFVAFGSGVVVVTVGGSTTVPVVNIQT